MYLYKARLKEESRTGTSLEMTLYVYAHCIRVQKESSYRDTLTLAMGMTYSTSYLPNIKKNAVEIKCNLLNSMSYTFEMQLCGIKPRAHPIMNSSWSCIKLSEETTGAEGNQYHGTLSLTLLLCACSSS